MSFGGDFLKTELPSLSLLANGLFFMMSGCRFCRLPQYVHYPHEIRFHLKKDVYFLSLAKQQCLIQCMAFSGCAAAPGPSWCSAGRPTRAPHGYVMLPFPTGWWDFKSQISWLHNLSYDWPGVPAGWTCSADGYKFFFNLQKGMIVLVQHLELIYYTGIFLALNVKCCNGRYQIHSWAFKGREVHSYPSRPALDVVLVWKRNAFAFE